MESKERNAAASATVFNRFEVKITVSSGKCDIHILDMSTGLHFANLRMSYEVMSSVIMRCVALRNKDALT